MFGNGLPRVMDSNSCFSLLMSFLIGAVLTHLNDPELK